MPTPSSASAARKKVAFSLPVRPAPTPNTISLINSSVKLCQLLGNEQHCECAGLIGHDNETYHLHPAKAAMRIRPDGSRPLTLDDILSDDYEDHLTRRQRYSIALLLASSVAQLQFAPWLQNGLTKKDVRFLPCIDNNGTIPHYELFIRQGFPSQHLAAIVSQPSECNFTSLGILLLELCFGRRLEDHPLRKKHLTETGDIKQALDLLAATKWSQGVSDKGGDEYASAVKWCFFTSAKKTNDSWRGEIIKSVIRPLEKCQEHFKAAGVT